MKRLLVSFFLICMIAPMQSQEETFKVGDSIPEFKLWLLNGERLTQKNVKDKVVVFKFWYTTCIACVTDIPLLNELVIQLENRDDVLFIAPALDRKESLQRFLQRNPFLFTIAYSAIDTSEKFNKTKSYPSFFVIDKKGKFTYVDNDTKKSDFSALRKAILAALKE